MSKMIFIKYLPPVSCWAQIRPKIKSVSNLLKLKIFDISNMQISLLMSKIIFVKYLPFARPKLAHKFLA